MTTALMTLFVQQRPFVPFEIITVDGRRIDVRHSDFSSLERYVAAVTIIDETGRVEMIDTSLIVSLRSLEPLP